MPEITITLSDEVLARLREVAEQRGESPEQTVEALIESTLPQEPLRFVDADDPKGFKRMLSHFGSLTWPGTEGTIVNTTNEEIDRILAEEYMNPHDDKP